MYSQFFGLTRRGGGPKNRKILAPRTPRCAARGPALVVLAKRPRRTVASLLANGTVALKAPDDISETVRARNPKNLGRLPVGDELLVMVSLATAIAIEKESGKLSVVYPRDRIIRADRTGIGTMKKI